MNTQDPRGPFDSRYPYAGPPTGHGHQAGPQHSNPWPLTPPPAKPKARKLPKILAGVAGALLLLVIVGVATGGGGSSSSAGSSTVPTTSTTPAGGYAAPAPTQTAEPSPAADAGIGEGTYLVGVDIEPGTYRSTGARQDSIMPMCYWARLADTSGGVGSIIANDVSDKGSQVVTVKAGDNAFETNGCAPWQKIK